LEWRKFGYGLAGILTILGTFHWIKGNSVFLYLYLAAIVVLLTAFVVPVVLKPLYILFTWIGVVMGWIMTRVIVTIVFYLVLTPISLISRLTGKQFLESKLEPESESYWIDRGVEEPVKENFEKQH